VAAAEVVHLESGTRATTDSAGRFTFTGLREGTVAFWAPWLDSLDLPALRAPVTTDSDAPLLLATPTFAAYFRARCGFDSEPGQGLIVGHAIAESAERTVVAASWANVRVDGVSVRNDAMMAVDTVSVGDSFTLCGVPSDGQVTVAAAGNGSAGPLVVELRGPVTALSLRLSSDEQRATLSGRVRTTNGQAVANAEVSWLGAAAPSVRSGPGGEFVLADAPLRSGTLWVRAVGFQEQMQPIHPIADESSPVLVELAPIAPELAAMVVTAERWVREREDFERRRRGATGSFITDEMLKNIPQISANTLAAMVPRLGTTSSRIGTRRMLQLRRGMGFCSPRFFEDGLDVGKLDLSELIQQQFDLIERAKRIEIYSASQAPPRFNDNDGCGAIVVWTR